MSALRLSLRAARAVAPRRIAPTMTTRHLATPPTKPSSESAEASTAAGAAAPTAPVRDMTPTPITTAPQFPAPSDPFNPSEAPGAAGYKSPQYSEGTKTLVKGVARIMGYNSKASTAIRETGRMMRGVVEAVEADRAFWYDSESASRSATSPPPTPTRVR